MRIYQIQEFIEGTWVNHKDKNGLFHHFDFEYKAIEMCRNLEESFCFKYRFRVISWELSNMTISYEGAQ